MASREEIERILRAELDNAILCAQDAAMRYRKILDELAHGSPCSKDANRIEEAAETELAARGAMWKALLRFTDFSHKGKIPDDLEQYGQIGRDTNPPGDPEDVASTPMKRGLASHG
jgi:hypothetical protein